MSLYGPALQSVGAIAGLLGAKQEAKAAGRVIKQRVLAEQSRINRSYEYLRAKNKLKRVKQGISLASPVVQVLEMQSERDKQEAISESVALANSQLQQIAAVEQGRKYASLIGMADPWTAYEQRQKTLKLRKETDDARLKALKEQNAFLSKTLTALQTAVPRMP